MNLEVANAAPKSSGKKHVLAGADANKGTLWNTMADNWVVFAKGTFVSLAYVFCRVAAQLLVPLQVDNLGFSRCVES